MSYINALPYTLPSIFFQHLTPSLTHCVLISMFSVDKCCSKGIDMSTNFKMWCCSVISIVDTVIRFSINVVILVESAPAFLELYHYLSAIYFVYAYFRSSLVYSPLGVSIYLLRILAYLPLQPIEAKTKWTPFRRHFQVHFLEWKCLNSD